MFYAMKYSSTVYVVAASTLLDFQSFADSVTDLTTETVEASRCDFIDMLTEDALQGFSLAPCRFECSSENDADNLIARHLFTMVKRAEAMDLQEKMIEHAKLAEKLGGKRDRRTLAEVHGWSDDDLLANASDKERDANIKLDERMKKLREAGQITSDSFGNKQGDKVNIHSVEVQMDENKQVASVSVGASKNNMANYDIIIDGVETFDFDTIFDELKLPESRVVAEGPTQATVRLHDHEVDQLTKALDAHKVVYALNKEADETSDVEPIEGHERLRVFFAAKVDGLTVHEINPIFSGEGFDHTKVVTMRNVRGGCWVAFAHEAEAKEAADIINRAGYHAHVAAINRKGQSIIGEGSDAVVVDNNAEIEILPRPWNDRAGEIDAMTEEEKVELIKGIKPSEFLFTLDAHSKHKVVVTIQPESFFRDRDELWTGELPILQMVENKILEPIPDDDRNFVFRCTRLEMRLLKDNMCRWGFVESLLLRIYLNDEQSEMRAGLTG